MAVQTNITDEGDRAGTTKTTLVSTHDRGAQDWARRQQGGKPNLPPDGTPAVQSEEPTS